MTVAPDHYVLRLDVAMDDARGVCLFQRAGDLDRHVEDLDDLHRRCLKSLTKRLPFDVFRSNEMTAAFVTQFINREDVRMIQA